MKRNLFIYEGNYGISKKTAEIFAFICSNGKVCNVNKIDADINMYDNIIFVVGFYGKNTAVFSKDFILKNRRILLRKTIAYIGVGVSEIGREKYLKDIEKALDKKIDYDDFVHGELKVNRLNEEDKMLLNAYFKSVNMKLIDMGKFRESEACEKAAKLSKLINKNEKVLNKEDLKREIDKFISFHNTCAFASGDNDFVRCTPIEYLYYNDNFYFFSEGGLKFKGIIENSNVSLAIFEEYVSFQSLKGLQAKGKAEILEWGCREYEEVMKNKGIKKDFLEKSLINMNIVRVNILEYEFLNSDFEKEGYDIKQLYLN